MPPSETAGHPMAGPSVLFVCLGNICRSPLAEAAFRAEMEERGWSVPVDSAGTGDWHIGHAPDPRAQAEAKRHGIDISAYRARQVTADDFERFDRIFALDTRNLDDLRALAPAGGADRVQLLLDIVPGREGQAVADPYYGDDAGFAVTWDEVATAARHLADAIEQGV